jgi:hypothetical protein
MSPSVPCVDRVGVERRPDAFTGSAGLSCASSFEVSPVEDVKS